MQRQIPRERSTSIPFAPPENAFPRVHAVRVAGTAPPPLLPGYVQSLSVPLFAGSIPGPIAFGWVIDKACLLWQDQCGQQGSCFVYQNSAMSWYLLIAGLGYKVSRAASLQGHCGGGVGAPESTPKSQSLLPLVWGSGQPLGSSNSFIPHWKGCPGYHPCIWFPEGDPSLFLAVTTGS